MTLARRLTGLARGGGSFTDPLDLSPIAWYDFSDISTLWQDEARTVPVTSLDEHASGVTDKSGNGHHLTSDLGGGHTGPLYKPAAQNGLSVVEYGASSTLSVSDSLSISQPDCIAVVAKVTSGTSEHLFEGDSSRQIVGNDGGGNWLIYAGTPQTGSIASDTSFHAHIVNWNGASSAHYIDGATNTTANPGAGGLDYLRLGWSSGSYFHVQEAELVICGAALGAGDRADLLAYFQDKWGTP